MLLCDLFVMGICVQISYSQVFMFCVMFNNRFPLPAGVTAQQKAIFCLSHFSTGSTEIFRGYLAAVLAPPCPCQANLYLGQ